MNKGFPYIFLTAFLYSTQEIANKILIKKGLDSFQITFIIFLIGAVLLTPLAMKDIKKRNIRLKFKDFAYFAFSGFLCIPVSMALLSLAGKFTQASTSAVIFSANAVFTVPFAYFILKEKVEKATLIALLVSITGVIAIFDPVRLMAGMNGGSDIMGVIISLGAAVTWSLFTVVSKMKIDYYGGYIFNCFIFYFGSAMVFLILLLTGRPITAGIDLSALYTLIYMGLFVKALGYIFYLGAIRITSAVTASTVFLVKPALATVLAVLGLGEQVTPNMLVGIVLIVFGSYIPYRLKKKVSSPSPNVVKSH